ncbi:citrulline utilization hydrolase CtlX [Flavihumibacter fluvii]|uniref:citrulline utilization hydrolase CtlX n=1 Tax=Flavihumibacter fluvii TaxID=2838157 RepID=UPI001BDF5F66|nr:arginine deiminase-related protein [Flavihumibacter fluvii]ULQ53772.1 arginine deiminase-related protein [Flavihumibacter fluvii]
MQTTSNILMIRPVNFSFNAETAVNNAFQVKGNDQDAQLKARNEFDNFVFQLQQKGIHVTVIDDTPEPYTPDSIFPNNWVSFHDDGTVVLYPMFAANRRAERKQHVLDQILRHFEKRRLIDLTGAEADHHFLEGTGSMVLDRDNRIAYACLSPRTDQSLLKEFCDRLNFTPVTFFARDQNGQEIYHTNVMMCVADQYVVICLASITDEKEKATVLKTIAGTHKKIIDITLDQMNSFAGNMLQVRNNMGDPFLVMSSQAFNSLNPAQKADLEAFNPIIHADISTIETNGGGSARCMMAEIFLPEKSSL